MSDKTKTPDLLVFPKFFHPHLAVERLAEEMLSCGFDGVDVIIRRDYWCTDENYAETLPDFAREMRRRGLKCYTATTNWTHENVADIERAYAVFADNGIAMFRFWMQNYRGPGTFRTDLDACKRSLARLEALGRKHGVKALIQTHGGTMAWSPEAAYLLVHALDPRAVGVHYDPGNMRHQEGWTDPAKAIDVLGAHLAYVGVKNCGWFLAPDPKDDQRMKWRPDWTRLEIGMVDWGAILAGLSEARFAGPFCMHNFYAHTLEGLLEGTRADVGHFRALLRGAFAGAED